LERKERLSLTRVRRAGIVERKNRRDKK